MFSTELQNKLKIALFVFVVFCIPKFSNATVVFSDFFDLYVGDTTLANSTIWTYYNGGSLSNILLSTDYYTQPKSITKASTPAVKICSKSAALGTDFYVSLKLKKPTANTLTQFYFNVSTLDTCISTNWGSSAHALMIGFNYYDNGSACDINLYQSGYSGSIVQKTVACPTVNNWADLLYLYKHGNYAQLCLGAECTSDLTLGSPSTVFHSANIDVQPSLVIDNFQITSDNPTIIDAICGADNGQTLTSEPVNFCSVGSLVYPSYVETPTGWNWTCAGINGGNSADCSAIQGEGTTGGICGADNGQTLTSEPVNFCSTGTLIVPSYVETPTGWTWDCQGNAGGSIDHCYAIMDNSLIINFPDLPIQDDCSGLSNPDKWICEISNFIKSAFLPTSTKLNELNISLSSIGTKAPFNYINSASVSIANIKNNVITSDTLAFSLLGNTGYIDMTAWGSENLAKIKRVFSLLLGLGFLVWAINYIKSLLT